MAGVYDNDGRLRMKPVAGTSLTGAYSADGEMNAVIGSVGTSMRGLRHPSGALNVTIDNSDTMGGFYAADGSMRVNTTGILNGSIYVYGLYLASGLLGEWADTTGGIAIVPEDDSIKITDPNVPSNDYEGSLNEYLRTKSFTTCLPAPKLTLQSDGVYRYQPHNLLAMSERFDSAVTVKSGSSVTESTAGGVPSGFARAFKVVESATTAQHALNTLGALAMTVGQIYTLTVRAKAAERTMLFLQGLGTFAKTYFDLSSGTIASAGAGYTNTITPLGDGWYACSISFTADTTTLTTLVAALTTGAGVSSYAGDGTSGLYLTGAQLNLGTEATSYVKTQTHNLCLRSQEFDNASWTAQGGTITANTITAPDGTATADVFTENTLASGHDVYGTSGITVVSGAVYTASCYIKAGTNDKVLLYFQAGGAVSNISAVFDLANPGTTATQTASTGSGTPGTVISTSIEAVGNGWYRCAIVGSIVATSARVVVGQANAATGNTFGSGGGLSYTGASRTISIWGAQLTLGTTPGKYSATTSAAVYESHVTLPYEWDASGNALGYIPNEARTNSCIRSQEFDSASWSLIAATVTANSTTAPDGTATADSLADMAASSNHFILSANIAVVSGTTYVLSVHGKSGTDNKLQLTAPTAAFSGAGYANFDLSTGTVSATGGALVGSGIEFVGNGWYRCWIAVTATATTNGSITIGRIDTTTASRLPFYVGTSTTIHVFGAQVEAGSFPTSYIPTTSAAVTRNADNVSLATSLFPSLASAYTAFIDCAWTATIANATAIEGWTGSGVAGVTIAQHSSPAGIMRLIARSGAARADTQGNAGLFTVGQSVRGALGSDGSTTSLSVDGSTISSVSIPAQNDWSTATSLQFGKRGNGTAMGSVHIKRVMLVPRLIAQSDANTLTAA